MQYVADRLFAKVSGGPTVDLLGPGGERYRRYDWGEDEAILGQHRAATPEERKAGRRASILLGGGLTGFSAGLGSARAGFFGPTGLRGAGAGAGVGAVSALTGLGIGELLNRRKMYRLERGAGYTHDSVDRYLADRGIKPITND